MKAILFVTLALLIARGHAETSSSESPEFPVELGSARSVAAVTTAEFPVDLRMKGGVGSTGSAEFVVNTKSGSLQSLAIFPNNPICVVAGEETVFQAMAHVTWSAQAIDVSGTAVWKIIGNSPAGTRFGSNTLIGGDVAVPTSIRVAAAFKFPNEWRESESVEVTIMPNDMKYQMTVVYSIVGPPALSNYLLTCNAVTSSPEGAAQAQNVHWDLNQDGVFNDATGMLASREYANPQTLRIGVRAEWPQAGGPPKTASSFFFLTLDKPAVPGEPNQGIARDAVNGSFLDSDGVETAPLASRKANGLVILTHGLHDAGTNVWLPEMYDAIATRITQKPPNIAIYDWHEMADPTEASESWTTVDDAISDFVKVRPNGNAQGIMLAEWIERQCKLGKVERLAKIHLIGHSAGGFVVGETARILHQRGYPSLQVTMLDTPLPYHEHIQPFWRTERYISSVLGGNPATDIEAKLLNWGAKGVGSKVDYFMLTTPPVWVPLIAPHHGYYRKVIDPKVYGIWQIVAQHSASHEYYTATVSSNTECNLTWYDDDLSDGFNQSFLLSDAVFNSSPQALAGPQTMPAPQNDGPQPSPPDVPPMNDFSTFGDVQQTGSVYRVTEAANAGIFKNLKQPVGATTLQFQLRVITPGDGDFVSVHWNDGDALAIIPETSLAVDAPLLHEIDITGLGGQTGTLTLKLISRGVANGVVEFSEIRILESDDVDGDGLTNTEEAVAGSDVFDRDSDGDNLTDGAEVHTLGTSPVLRDTDGDGQDDAGELGAGTDPLVPQSRFAAVMESVVPGVSASVRWNGVTGRSYRVVRSQELGTLNIDFLKAGMEGVNGPMTYTDPNPPLLRAFYWVEVE